MAITSLAQVISGMQPPVNFQKVLVSGGLNFSSGLPMMGSCWAGTASWPVAGGYDTTLNGVTLSSATAGCFAFNDPPSGNAYLARFEATAKGVLNNSQNFEANYWLCDRLWHNGGIDVTSTSPQAITSPTWPARDENGATSGAGILLAVEISVATGASNPGFITVSYTNSTGVSGRTATNIKSTIATAVPAGAVYLLDLQAGDVGVRSVQSITLNATWTSGTINLVAYRFIAELISPLSGRLNAIDAISGCLPQIFNGSCLYLMWKQNVGANSSANPSGQLIFTNG